MSVFGVRKEFSDVNTPKTSISASAEKDSIFEVFCSMKLTKTCKRRGAIKIKYFSFVNKYILLFNVVLCLAIRRLGGSE